jgi:hypothetical protein
MKRGVPEAYHDVTVAKKPAVFLRCETPLMMWWTVPAPGNELP